MDKDAATLTGVSDTSIEKATGNHWRYWIQYLDKQEAEKLSHKEIVAILRRKIDNEWWCQMIANGYEKYKGKRILGQTETGFQVGVTKTLNIDKNKLWDIISSEEGIRTWLGKTKDAINKHTAHYQTEEGISGNITVLKPGSHFRLTWQPKEWNHKSILQVRTLPKKEKSVLSFHQEGLSSSAERKQMKAHWNDKINQLMKLIDSNYSVAGAEENKDESR